MRATVLRFVCGGLLLLATSALADDVERAGPPHPSQPVVRPDSTSLLPPVERPGGGPAPRPAPPVYGSPPRQAWGSTSALERHVKRALERATTARRMGELKRGSSSLSSASAGAQASTARGGTALLAQGTHGAAQSIPDRLAFGPVFPNPSAGQVTFRVDLPRDADVRIRILDVAGRVVHEIRERGTAGRRAYAWDGGTRAPRSGVYFACLEVDGRAAGNRRLVVLR